MSRPERLRVLFAIHDFLPRHRAGSELAADRLARALERRGHSVTVVATDYRPAEPHGTLSFRDHESLPVAEIAANWTAATFDRCFDDPVIGRRLETLLDAISPDVVHVHSLLELGFALPRLARRRGIPVVASLHDFSLPCASGGQRVHLAEEHVCLEIDTDRCARCFAGSPWQARRDFARVALAGPARRTAARGGAMLRRAFPAFIDAVAPRLLRAVAAGSAVTRDEIEARLATARETFRLYDAAVAPSEALAGDLVRFGFDSPLPDVSDYGFPPLPEGAIRRPEPGIVRFGFVGTLAWHKGVHLLLEAVRRLPNDGRWSLALHGDPGTFPAYSDGLRAAATGFPIRFAGPFSDGASTAAAWSALDALVVPSLWPENSPLVVHEAFQAGIPVVASRRGGLPAIVGHDVSGLLVEPGSADSLAAALRRLVDEPGLVDRLAANVPPVKPIDDEAAEWEGRYRRALARATTGGEAA